MSDIEQRPQVLYTAEATVQGGRKGHGATSDGVVEVDFTSPKELGGDGARGTNPEQLFALGFAACWENAMLGIARRKGLDVEDAVVTARVGIGRIESGRLGLAVELLITLPSLPGSRAGRGTHRRGGAALPVLQCGARQRRGHAHAALTMTTPHSADGTVGYRRRVKHLWAPWRMAYVSGSPPDSDGSCFLCAAASGDDPLVVDRGELAFILMNRYPYTSGHLMAVPVRHAAGVLALTARRGCRDLRSDATCDPRAHRRDASGWLQHRRQPGQCRRRERGACPRPRGAAVGRRHEFHARARRRQGASAGSRDHRRQSARGLRSPRAAIVLARWVL